MTLNRIGEWPEWKGWRHDIETAAALALSAVAPDLSGELSITLLTDAEIQELNLRFLGHDRTTDVLSFSLGDDDGLIGDVYVSPGEVQRNSVTHGVPHREEALRVVIHGTLHVLGLDHPAERREESDMFRLQERLLRSLGGS